MDAVSLPTDVLSLALRLTVAALLGATLGLNRELSMKPAGLRTHALVALGAALATITGLLLTTLPGAENASTSRIVQGIFAGVGFIGGGVILHRGDNRTIGLTTAASIWIVSAAGVATGAGLWRSALIAVVLALLILSIGGRVDRALHSEGTND
jgi:putative Mg2+ transporter-C (MgtC) family protein